ncbi:flagellar hook-length control protein FliK [Thalassotalea ganghwensis]
MQPIKALSIDISQPSENTAVNASIQSDGSSQNGEKFSDVMSQQRDSSGGKERAETGKKVAEQQATKEAKPSTSVREENTKSSSEKAPSEQSEINNDTPIESNKSEASGEEQQVDGKVSDSAEHEEIEEAKNIKPSVAGDAQTDIDEQEYLKLLTLLKTSKALSVDHQTVSGDNTEEQQELVKLLRQFKGINDGQQNKELDKTNQQKTHGSEDKSSSIKIEQPLLERFKQLTAKNAEATPDNSDNVKNAEVSAKVKVGLAQSTKTEFELLQQKNSSTQKTQEQVKLNQHNIANEHQPLESNDEGGDMQKSAASTTTTADSGAVKHNDKTSETTARVTPEVSKEIDTELSFESNSDNNEQSAKANKLQEIEEQVRLALQEGSHKTQKETEVINQTLKNDRAAADVQPVPSKIAQAVQKQVSEASSGQDRQQADKVVSFVSGAHQKQTNDENTKQHSTVNYSTVNGLKSSADPQGNEVTIEEQINFEDSDQDITNLDNSHKKTNEPKQAFTFGASVEQGAIKLSSHAMTQGVSASYSASEQYIAAQAIERHAVNNAEATNQKQMLNQHQETIAIYGKNFNQAVKDKVMVMMNQKLQQVEIRLDPPELGSMQVKVNMQNEQAIVSFVVQNQQAKDALEQNLNKLRDMMSDSGVNVGDASVEQQEKQTKGDSEQGELSRHQQGNDADTQEIEMGLVGNQLYKASATGVDYYV